MMEKKFEEIINNGKKTGKTMSQINEELKAAGAPFHLDYTMTPDGPRTGWSEKEMAEGFVTAGDEPGAARRTLDMRRRMEFAGTKQIQQIPGGKFEVTYNEDGMAKSAVRIYD